MTAPQDPDLNAPAPAPDSDNAPGMEQQQNPRDSRRDGSRHDLPDDAVQFGATADEAALRALMHNAVEGLHPSPDALEHLRRAIPLRRQRRRQAAFGAVAAVLLVGMAVPAVIHAAGRSGGPSAAPARLAGAHSSTPDGDGSTYPGGASYPAGPASAPPGATSNHPAGGGPTWLPVSPSGTALPAPTCSGAQLGQGASQADSPDSDGRVYGWFRVANVSGTACTVPSGGVVQAVAQGSADQAEIQVVDHTQGDPASGLPQTTASGPVVLSPGQDYEVAFAFVPAATASDCSSPTATPTTPTPSDSATPSGGTDTGGDAGSTSGGGGEQAGGFTPAPPPPASIALNHTPAAGGPVVVGPVIQGACAGTVYTTAAMPEPTDAPVS